MMADNTAFIWDLDGTLLDSYGVIVSSLAQTCRMYGSALDEETIRREVMTGSVRGFLAELADGTGVPFERLYASYSAIADGGMLTFGPMPHAEETLRFLREKGARSFVFTHRGSSSEIILRNVGLRGFFGEIVTGKDGFARKPSPEALAYLIEKHGLVRSETFYVGDRSLDVACACGAGIGSILYRPSGSVVEITGKESFVVADLSEIRQLFA